MNYPTNSSQLSSQYTVQNTVIQYREQNYYIWSLPVCVFLLPDLYSPRILFLIYLCILFSGLFKTGIFVCQLKTQSNTYSIHAGGADSPDDSILSYITKCKIEKYRVNHTNILTAKRMSSWQVNKTMNLNIVKFI